LLEEVKKVADKRLFQGTFMRTQSKVVDEINQESFKDFLNQIA
jgi:hypothetical protein